MDAASLLKEGNLADCKTQLFNEIKKDPSNVHKLIHGYRF